MGKRKVIAARGNTSRGYVPQREHYAVPKVKGPAPFGWLSQETRK